VSGPTGTVLLIEDDDRIASFINRAVRALGLAGAWAQTGGEGLARIAEGDVVTLVLDLNLPDMDGMDVLRAVRSRPGFLPVVVVTARNNPEDRVTAVELGVEAYLRKPFPLADLLDHVRRSAVRDAGPDRR
jgi:two-component system response regulator QseB